MSFSQRLMTVRRAPGKFGSHRLQEEDGGGLLYVGDFDSGGVKSGLGHLEVSKCGSSYDGAFRKGLPNGAGVMRFADSSRWGGIISDFHISRPLGPSRYEGEFMQGWFHGHGVFQTIAGIKFEGELDDHSRSDKSSGRGLIAPGEFRGGRLWGKGLLSFNDGKTGSEGYFQVVQCNDVKSIVVVVVEETCKSMIDRPINTRCCIFRILAYLTTATLRRPFPRPGEWPNLLGSTRLNVTVV